MIQLMRGIDDDESDWLMDDLPRALGQLGEAALDPLEKLLLDETAGVWTRSRTAGLIGEIAEKLPAHRARAVEALAKQLQKFKTAPPIINSGVVAALVELKAVEKADLIRSACVYGTVEEDYVGTWEQIREELGLSTRRDMSRPIRIDLLGDAVDGLVPKFKF
jgi:hypothetical protein